MDFLALSLIAQLIKSFVLQRVVQAQPRDGAGRTVTNGLALQLGRRYFSVHCPSSVAHIVKGLLDWQTDAEAPLSRPSSLERPWDAEPAWRLFCHPEARDAEWNMRPGQYIALLLSGEYYQLSSVLHLSWMKKLVVKWIAFQCIWIHFGRCSADISSVLNRSKQLLTGAAYSCRQ